jgi:2-hydroxychromene-2-carboxylate isomerase
MAVHRLLAAVPDAHDVLDFIPFWDPDPDTEAALANRDAQFHYATMSKAKHLYILQDTKRLAGKLGLAMRWPVDIDSWWEVPHLAWLRAHEIGLGPPFFAAVLAARWERGEDICDPAVIAAVGASVGADGTELAAAATDPRIRAAAVGCLVQAYEDDVFGVPYFLTGPHRFWGFDRVGDFLAVLRPAEPQAVTLPVAPPPGAPTLAYDTDTAGGCG